MRSGAAATPGSGEGSGGFRSLPAQIADEVPKGSGADGSGQKADEVLDGSGVMADEMLEGSGWLIKVHMTHEVPDGSGAGSRQSC